MDNCDKLLPAYLRFLRGVVDSEDLPLNVSREMLQEHRRSRRDPPPAHPPRARPARRRRPSTSARPTQEIWDAFGVFLKEGLARSTTPTASELTALLRFATTGGGGEDRPLVSLAEYIERMPEGQEAIYYITGENAAALRTQPPPRSLPRPAATPCSS